MTPAILHIEDDANDVLFLQIVLKRAGVTCPLHVARDGQQALDYIEGKGSFSDREKYPVPYLVLLDLKLPYVMGLGLLKRLRENPEFDSTIVIVLTSSNDPSDVDTAYRLRANAYLVKPAGMAAMETLARNLKEFWLTLNQRSSAFA
jgi:CheY-like chemotaxis protein